MLIFIWFREQWNPLRNLIFKLNVRKYRFIHLGLRFCTISRRFFIYFAFKRNFLRFYLGWKLFFLRARRVWIWHLDHFVGLDKYLIRHLDHFIGLDKVWIGHLNHFVILDKNSLCLLFCLWDCYLYICLGAFVHCLNFNLAFWFSLNLCIYHAMRLGLFAGHLRSHRWYICWYSLAMMLRLFKFACLCRVLFCIVDFL